MNRAFRSSFRVALVFAALAFSSTAFAQATRTWVSGVGDDANPCSRTAPCKTFAGAISKTAAGGEISVLDPGGYGAVTITKAITINGQGTLASILAAGTNGVVINAGVNDVVVLRDLSIHGAGTGLNGIRFLAGSALQVDNLRIQNFTGRGIEFAPAGTSELVVNDTVITNAGTGAVLISPGALGAANAQLDNVTLTNSQFGVRVNERGTVAVSNCTISGHVFNGILAFATAGVAQATANECTFSGNGTTSDSGAIKSQGAGADVYLSGNTISGNFNGLYAASSGSIISFGNNAIAGNGVDGNPTSTIPRR